MSYWWCLVHAIGYLVFESACSQGLIKSYTTEFFVLVNAISYLELFDRP